MSEDVLEEFEEDEMTAAEVYKMLTVAWNNEKTCPDLLKNQNDLVECLMDQLNQMEENLKSLTPDDFLVYPHRMEMERIRYVISSYLRTRLEKIEAYTVFLVRRDKAIPNEEDRYMSEAEFAFAEECLRITKDHFQAEVSRYAPSLLHLFRGITDVEVKPNFKNFVFIKMLKPREGVLVKGSPVNLTTDAYHLLPYKDVKILIEDGSAVCI